MKHKKLIFFVATAILSLGIVTPFAVKASEELEPDNAVYGDRLEVDYDHPDVKFEAPPIKKAVSSASSIKFHYHNDDGNCLDREFWVWCDGVNGSAHTYDSDGTGTDITLSISFTGDHANFAGKDSVSFIVKTKDTWVGQSENLVIKYDEYPPNDSGLLELWCIPGEGNAVEVYKTEEETHMDRFQLATFENWKKISIIATNIPVTYRLYALTSTYMSYGKAEKAQKLNDYLIASGSNPTCTDVIYNSLPAKKFEINLNYTARPNVQYYLEGVFPEPWSAYTKTKYVSLDKLYSTDRFVNYYNYSGDDLGATYNDANSTTFRVWAPTAARVLVYLYNSGTSEKLAERYTDIQGDDTHGGYNMAFRPGGIWQVTIKGKDLKNKYYTYYVVNSLGANETIDPYAKACGVNGDRGMIVNWADTNPTGWDAVPQVWDKDTNGYDITSPQQLSIYETHIRDVTMDSSWTGSSMRGTYTAFVESGTKLSDGVTPTGFSHITNLGVKAVQLEPVFDQDNNEDYGTPAPDNPDASRRVNNWGYNPKNYNCVEGSYATDPYDGASRITEFKSMVQAYATNGNHTRIIMDVVYNHVASAPGSCFNKLMPKYYFRYAPDGTYFDGSGCGNEVRSEAPMMRKYIVDSLCFWASEYKIKGFRFDLMALIDVGTIDEARKALYKIDPDIYIYGEGWTGDGSGYDYTNQWTYQVHGNEDLHDDGTDSHNNLTPDQIKLLGCTRSSVFRYLYPTDNACFVGSFNDSGRNALKGENNAGSKGYLSGNLGDGGGNLTKVADMMAGYFSGYGGNPQQCVNYASCHDNFTLFDQFSLTETTYTAGMACAATAAAECAVLFSNGIAFIHGGEELFRTKEVTSEADLELSNPDTRVLRLSSNTYVSHNSYNLSDDVNAYKWDRLKSVTLGSETINVSSYSKAIKDAVQLRNHLAFYSAADLEAHHPFLQDSPFNIWTNAGRQDPPNDKWPKWDGATAIGIYNAGYQTTCLLTSLSAPYNCNSANPTTSSMQFNSNPFATITYSDGKANLGGAHCIAFR